MDNFICKEMRNENFNCFIIYVKFLKDVDFSLKNGNLEQEKFKVLNEIQFIIMDLPWALSSTLAPAGIFSGGGMSTTGGLVRGVAGKLSKFKKKSMKNLQFLIILIENLPFFNVLKFYRIFLENFGNNFGKYENMRL